jgi:hypothetical protein
MDWLKEIGTRTQPMAHVVSVKEKCLHTAIEEHAIDDIRDRAFPRSA